jgi:hypothetical protein
MSDRDRCDGITRKGFRCELHRFGGVLHSGPCARVVDLGGPELDRLIAEGQKR